MRQSNDPARHADEQRVIEDHRQTAHKLALYRGYVGAWGNILAQAKLPVRIKHLFFLDTHCGAGRHGSREHPDGAVIGTPLMACHEARRLQRRYPGLTVHAVLGLQTGPVQLVAATPTSFTFVALSGHAEHAPGATITFSIYQQGPDLYLRVTATYENNDPPVGWLKQNFSWNVWFQMSFNVIGMAYELANGCLPTSFGNPSAPPSFD
jgi:hypothetical protein